MTIQIIVNVLLTLSLPIMIWLGYWIAQFQIMKLPLQQRNALEQFARMAVQHVEQKHGDSLDKEALALAYTRDLFKGFGLPVPTPLMMEVAVNAAFYEAAHLRHLLSSLSGEKKGEA